MMMDEKDLQAIAQMLARQKEEILHDVDAKLAGAEQRIAQSTAVLMDAQFSRRFDLLSEGQQVILDKLKQAN